MRAKKLYFLIFLGWLTACSETGTEENVYPEPSATTFQPILFLTGSQGQQTITAFRQGDTGFAFLKTIPVTGPRTEAQLPIGKYQFLFAGSYGINTGINAATPGVTLFPAMRFSILPDETDPTYIRPGDELFLQEGKIDSIYLLEGPTTIRATLKRAVAQVILYIKRGYLSSTGEYVPQPYQNDSIVRYFSDIRLDIGNAGTAVDAFGTPEGQGTLSVTLAANSQDSITPEGFAVYQGPFFFPSADGQPLQLKLNLYRREDSPQPDLALTRQATVKRNEQLILNAWVTSDWNIIAVTADVRPISRETEGEQDIWDDNITF